MVQILKSWRRRFELWHIWLDKYNCDRATWIQFSFEVFPYEDRPLTYYASYDTDRWRKLFIELTISRFRVHMNLPFRKLPDYIPTEREQKYRDADAKRKAERERT